ncbi:MAG: ABC transporter substrate-binding protein [Alphaproteobacteria bacterium]|nr:ABC transporter substrate-binding protein [Alphaproteobacteria bacterium]
MRYFFGLALRPRLPGLRTGALLAGLLAMTAVAQPVLAEAAPKPETAIVSTLQDGLVEILQSPPPPGSGARSKALGDLVAQTFDINAMGAVAVGIDTYRNWTKEQRAAFLTAFARFMVATHANRFEGIQGHTFEIESSEAAQADRRIVHSRYLRTDKDPVAVDYLVQMTGNGWRILDVYLDGTVSLLALHRAEFTSVLRNQGFDGFIAAMNAKADELNPPAATN